MQDDNKEELENSPQEEKEESSYRFDEEDDFEYEENDNIDTEEEYSGTDNENSDSNINEEYVSEEEKDSREAEKKAIKAERKASRAKKRLEFFKKSRKPFLIALSVIFLAFAVLFGYSLSTIKDDKVMNNVYIENLNVGGLSYEDTLASVNATYLFEKSQIILSDGINSYPISGSDIGLEAAPEDTTEKAYNYCKSGNFLIDGFNAMKLLFKPHVIIPAAQVNTEMLDAKLNEFANISVGELKQHFVEYGDDGYLTVYSGQTGYNGDPSTAREQVINALNNENFTDIHVDFTAVPPDAMTIESFDALVYKDPVNASYEVNGNEVSIVPGETGRFINKEEATPFMQNIYEGCQPVRIPYYISTPDVTEEMLRDKLFANTLSSYSTSYGTSSANRCANIARAASLINGTVIAPGGVFSFNDTVGHRTKENGFYTAKEYVDGQSVDGIGGGTCQVSSTLYSAVLYADMSIVERLNHMMTVGYIPLGQDATVSDGGVDFKFKNSSDYPVKISAYTSGATITISLIGTAWEPARKVEIKNYSSQVGENTVVNSTRYVYSNGELISKDELNSSTYMPHKS